MTLVQKVLAACTLVVFALACGRPALVVSTDASVVVIDMQRLGEYSSDVARVRLTEASTSRVLWEVKGQNEPQLGRVRLFVGENVTAVSDVRHGLYEVVVPAGASTFILEPGQRYLVEVWGKDGVQRTRRQAEFVAPVGAPPN